MSGEKKESKCRSLVTSIDIYGHPITLYYKGSLTFKTYLGGITTIMTVMMILGNALSSMESVIRQNYEINRKIVTINAFEDIAPYTLNRDNFELIY